MKRFYFLLFFFLPVYFIHAQTAVIPSAGDGSTEAPYEISSLENLYWMAEEPSRWEYHYVQVADIDALPTTEWFEEDGWLPIGNSDFYFTGSYNGQNFVINGLYINRPDTDYVGLFGFAKSAVLNNIRLTNVEIHGGSLVGGLVGVLGSTVGENTGSIENCHVTGIISGNDLVGGLAGETYDPVTDSSADIVLSGTGLWIGGLIGLTSEDVSRCSATGSVTANSSSWVVGGLLGECLDINVEDCSADVEIFGGAYLGGLIGAGGGIIVNCSATGNVTGTVNYSWSVGGLIGENNAHILASFASGDVKGDGYAGGLAGANYGFIEQSFATGNVEGEWEYSHGTGGLVGYNQAAGEIENSFARGDVTGHEDVGGFVGENAGAIENSYSTGYVMGTENYGGFCGSNYETINSSYWDMEISGQEESDGASGRTTDEMTYPYDEDTYVGWDFENIWVADEDSEMNDGYPFIPLQAETEYFELTLEVSPEGSGTVTGSGIYEAGHQVNISASPADNYIFLGWAGDTDHLDDEDNPQTFVIMPDFDITISAGFQLESAVEEADDFTLRIYPIPASEHIHFSFINSSAGDVRVALYSITGQLHEERFYSGKRQITDKINVQGLHPGIYLLDIYGDGIIKVQKLIVGTE